MGLARRQLRQRSNGAGRRSKVLRKNRPPCRVDGGVATPLRSLRAWLGPTFVGSLLGFWLVTVIYCLEWAEDGWLAELWAATGLGLGLGVMFLAVDVVLLRRKVRRLPQGQGAWGMALAGGFVAEFLYILPWWERDPRPSTLILAAKLFVTALTVRLLFGKTA